MFETVFDCSSILFNNDTIIFEEFEISNNLSLLFLLKDDDASND